MDEGEGMTSTDLISAVAAIGREVARPVAADVDRQARAPVESIQALVQARALGASVPSALGGGGLGLTELGRMCTALARHCGSSGMVLAMHHIQVLSIADHAGDSADLARYLGRVATEQRLIASVTSEVGTGGDLRRCVAGVQREGDRFSRTKEATTVSYGQVADDLLISVRRSEDAAPTDQVAVLALKGEFELAPRGVWDALGMRGTCSPPATIRAHGAASQILPESFGQIAGHTMVPVSHVLWASVWLGIAQDAVAVAREQLREQGRKGTESGSTATLELADLVRRTQLMQSEVESMAAFVAQLRAAGDRQATSSVGFALRINGLKLTASRMVVEVVTDALRVCGIAAYKNDSRFSLGRQLRDAHSAPLMINNARIADHNAQLALIFKGDNT